MYNSKQITLYVPCYNANSTIEQCLNSLLEQSIPVHSLFLVNDGSTEKLPVTSVPIINHPENLGLAAARNTALKACETSLIASVDSDVVVAKDWLEKLLDRMNSGDVVGVAGRMDEYYKKDIGDRWRARHMAQHWGEDALINPRFLFGANTLMKTEVLKSVGGFDTRCRTNNEDRTMCKNIYEKGGALAYEPSAKCFHLRRDTATTILTSYWGWHHAKGLVEGDFDSSEGVISRIRKVNFGISDYRFQLDEENYSEFALLDLLIPLVFAFKDISLFCRRTGSALPSFKPLVDCYGLSSTDLSHFIDIHTGGEQPDWYLTYIKFFKDCTKEFMLRERLVHFDLSSWLENNINDCGILT